jgi:hypothetical protein
MKRVNHWAVPVLATLVPLGLVVAVLAQQQPGQKQQPQQPPTQQPQPQQPTQRGDDVSRAKEMSQLISHGQMNLRDATALAEKHCNGTALEATCDIQLGMSKPTEPRERPGPSDASQEKPGQQPKPGEKAGEQKQTGSRLVYGVLCFANDKIHAVRVDGESKKVIDSKERKTLSSSARP